MLHQLLPRVMARLAGDDWGDQMVPSAELERLLREGDVANEPSGQEGEDDISWETLLEAITGDQTALTPAELKRKKMTFAAFQDPLLVSKALAIESLVQPNVHQMHKLFKRSAAIARLQTLPEESVLACTLAQQEIPKLQQERLERTCCRQCARAQVQVQVLEFHSEVRPDGGPSNAWLNLVALPVPCLFDSMQHAAYGMLVLLRSSEL